MSNNIDYATLPMPEQTTKVCLPDYPNAGTSNVMSSGTYTATTRTFFRVCLNFYHTSSDPDVSITINNKTVARVQGAATSGNAKVGNIDTIFHLAPGDVVRTSINSGGNWNTRAGYLIPERWV